MKDITTDYLINYYILLSNFSTTSDRSQYMGLFMVYVVPNRQ